MECKHDPAKLPGFGRLAGSCLHATFCLAQHHSARWPESAWLTSFCNFRNPGNNSLSGAEFCSLRAPFFNAALASEATTNSLHPNRTQHLRWTQSTAKKDRSQSASVFLNHVINSHPANDASSSATGSTASQRQGSTPPRPVGSSQRFHPAK